MTETSLTDSAIHVQPRTELKQKLRYENIKLLAEQGQASLLVTVVNALIVYLVLSFVAGELFLLIWVSILVLLSILRMIMVSRFFHLREDSDQLVGWLTGYLVAMYGSAACWGILPLTNFFFAESWTEAFIVFTVAAMSAGALVSMYAMLSAAIPYLVITVMPMIYALASSQEPTYTAMSLLASLYLLLLVRSAFILNNRTRRTIRLEMENEELFEFLLSVKVDGMKELAHKHGKGIPTTPS